MVYDNLQTGTIWLPDDEELFIQNENMDATLLLL